MKFLITPLISKSDSPFLPDNPSMEASMFFISSSPCKSVKFSASDLELILPFFTLAVPEAEIKSKVWFSASIEVSICMEALSSPDISSIFFGRKNL